MQTDSHPITRRSFLQTTGAIGLGSMLLPAQTLAAATESPVVPKRKFGRTGVEVSMLCLGGIFDTPNNQIVLRRAFDYGVTYWDTAEGYGHGASETGMGMFIEKNPSVRKELFLVTKSGSRDLEKSLTESLKRLKTDYADLYFIHGASSINQVNRPEIKAFAEKARKEGRIRFFGFSTHSNMEECLTDAAKLGWIDGIMLTYNYRVMHTPEMKAAIDAAVAAGIGLTAMKTIGKGLSFDTSAQSALLDPFKGRGFSAEQAKIKAVWENPHIATICSQMPNLNVLRQNVAAALDHTQLAWNDRDLLARYATATCDGYCAGCRQYCESALGGAVPVQDVLRHLMYHRHYDGEIDARALFAELPAGVHAKLATLDFTAAERACPHHLPIARLMREAVELLA